MPAVVKVTFYEKPGCANNTRQKQWLEQQCVTVMAADLLTHPWCADELLMFFGELPVAEWFNRSAPRVKSGDVVPEELSRSEALAVLLEEPLLIRRPLLCKDNEQRVGFDSAVIAGWPGIRIHEGQAEPGESCTRPERPCTTEESA